MIGVCCICGKSEGVYRNKEWLYQDFCPQHSHLLKNRKMKICMQFEMSEEDVIKWSEKLNTELAKLLVRKERIEHMLQSINEARFKSQITHENIETMQSPNPHP